MPTITIGHLVRLKWYHATTVERMISEGDDTALVDAYLAVIMRRLGVQP